MNSIFGVSETGVRTPQAETNFRYNLADVDFFTETTASGAVGVDGGLGFAETGTNSGTAQIEDRNKLRYRPGTASSFIVTLGFPERDGDATLRGGIFDDSDGIFIGHNGDTYEIGYRRDGVETTIPRSQWDDSLDGAGDSVADLDLSGLQVYRISFGYLGSAPFQFEVLTSSEDEQWTVFHEFEFFGDEQTNIVNPVLPPRLRAASSGTTNARVISGSWFAFYVNGSAVDPQQRTFTRDAARSALDSNTNEHLLTIRVKDTFQSQPNVIQTAPVSFRGTMDSTQRGFIRAVRNASFGTALSYTDVDTDSSVSEVSRTATTVSGGKQIGSLPISAGGGGRGTGAAGGDTSLTTARLNNGETVSFYVVTPGTIEDASVVVDWRELF